MSKHTIPHIAKQNGHPVLMVEDKPFILLAERCTIPILPRPHIWSTFGKLPIILA